MNNVQIWTALSFLLFLTPADALSEPAASVTDCDKYAGRELTRDLVGPAVSFERIDPSIALPACENAVQHYPESSRLRFQLARVKLRAGQFETAIGLLRPLAATDYAPALHQLGTMYFNGQGVDKSVDLAFGLFQWSAEEGDAYGQYWLGYMYEKGLGTNPDRELANLWYSKSADQGHTGATIKLAAGPVPPILTRSVTARSIGVIPGAIVCPDYATLTTVFQLYSSDWQTRTTARITKGQSKLIDGESSTPKLESFGCAFVAPGTAMALESNHVVPVVTVKLPDGSVVRGVTLPAMAGQ